MKVPESKRTWSKYEFGGPWGTAFWMVFLPVVVYYLFFSVRFNNGDLLPHSSIDYAPFGSFLDSITPTWKATAIYFSWFFFQMVLQAFIPGKTVEGRPVTDGSLLKYRLNGLVSFIITLVAVGAALWFKLIDFNIVYDNFGAMISVVTIFSYVFSLFLYFFGYKTNQVDRVTGNFIHDYWMGVPLNPRIPPVTGFDLKFFCEARPGLILWVLINFFLMGVQYTKLGFVTLPMILVCAFHFIYIADYFWNEPAILTTTDIMHDKFGWMLVFGDLGWVPFTYVVQAFYLIDHAHDLPIWGAALIVVLNFLGYYIFRAVNIQKHHFRQNPEKPIWGKKPEYIKTKQGNLLLVSGFWGWSRHFNFLGDICMALAWCLPCLFGSVVPYFYVIYFVLLLIHRERRDNKRCAIKYGTDWDEYVKRVRWRIIPGIY
jgi:protein-S-isoprenylcysteine O-methyltransferase Ste14